MPDDSIPLAKLLGTRDIVAIRDKMAAEGRCGPISDADAEAFLFKDRPDILSLFSRERAP